MDEYIQKTVKAYQDTETYEDSTRLLIPKLELDQFLEYLAPESVILDAGCAYGRDTEYIYQKGFQLEAIDLSPDLIARAKELHPNIFFQINDIRDTKFSNAQFDGIWCNATLLHLNDLDMVEALHEFYRILKPGGILAVSLKKGEGTKSFIEEFSSNSERYFNFKTHETFFELLRTAKFKEIAWHYLNERERYGTDKRDLDWLYSFSEKS